MKRKQQSSSEKDKSIIWKLPLLLLPLLVLFYLSYNNYISDVIFPFTIAIALIYVSFKKIQNFDLSKKWKTCQGTLLYTRVGVDNPYAQELVRSYYPYIKYSYIVKKNTYISEKVGHYRELRSSKECKPPQKLYYLKQNNLDKINQENACEKVSSQRHRS